MSDNLGTSQNLSCFFLGGGGGMGVEEKGNFSEQKIREPP